MNKTQITNLVDKALEAQRFAYAPYSKFKVGSALLTTGGQIFTGANIENSAFGATLCAEKVAVGKAVSQGNRDFSILVVVGDKGQLVMPCGSCRQIINEFSPECLIAILNEKKEIDFRTAKQSLPDAFSLKA